MTNHSTHTCVCVCIYLHPFSCVFVFPTHTNTVTLWFCPFAYTTLTVCRSLLRKKNRKDVPFQHLVRENASMLFDFCGCQPLLMAAKSLSSFLYIYTRFVSLSAFHWQCTQTSSHSTTGALVYFECIGNTKHFVLILFSEAFLFKTP